MDGKYRAITLLCTLAVAVNTQTFGCVNPSLTDRDRQMFYNAHNDARLSLAKGLEPNKCGRLSSGKNVYQLNWDCDMEAKVQEWATDCPNSFQTFDSTWGHNYVTYTGTISDQMGTAASAVNNWWSSVRTNGLTDPDNKYTNSALFQWANMAFGKTTSFACTYKACSGKFVVGCFYNKIGYVTNAVIYEKGEACSTDTDCTTYSGSSCRDGLCYQAPVAPVDPTFTMCPGQTVMSDQSRQKFVDTHNYLRSRLAKGLEVDGISAGALAPAAKQMTKIVYDCAIEQNAQSWAQNCLWQHSDSSARPGLGENMYYTTALNVDRIQSGEDASVAWWSELKDFGVGPDVILTNAVFRPRVGCFVQYCSDKTFTVCQYGPGGNVLDQSIYTKGSACTNDAGCPGTQTCSVAEGLCNVV
ncbi:unnamed protein product [Caenorhabditis auriculariae]|uniref:SCP domain-containing protein n=1 Tax=Caenorhabditis auriculariae TaxID=2777116 RepID=A0A8S1HFE8_9PELO|nr:unnamed protein product [Caenorhabditis auriculariae]